MAGVNPKSATIKITGGSEVLGLQEFTITNAGNIAAWVDNTSGGETTRSMGAGDSTGTLTMTVRDNATIPWKFGSTASVDFHIDGDDANYYTVPIIITSEPLTANLAGTDVLSIPYEWGQTGPVVRVGRLSASGV